MAIFFNKFKNGFTLIELLIVMAILGVLGTGVILLLNPLQQVKKANDARRKSELRYITNLLNLYYNDNGQYPPAANSTTTCALGPPNCYVYSTQNSSTKPWISALVPKYSGSLPVDPVNNATAPWNDGNYSYAYGNVSLDGQHYDLFTQLENQQDVDRCGLKGYQFNYDMGANGVSTNVYWCAGDSGNTFLPNSNYSNYIFQLIHE